MIGHWSEVLKLIKMGKCCFNSGLEECREMGTRQRWSLRRN